MFTSNRQNSGPSALGSARSAQPNAGGPRRGRRTGRSGERRLWEGTFPSSSFSPGTGPQQGHLPRAPPAHRPRAEARNPVGHRLPACSAAGARPRQSRDGAGPRRRRPRYPRKGGVRSRWERQRGRRYVLLGRDSQRCLPAQATQGRTDLHPGFLIC